MEIAAEAEGNRIYCGRYCVFLFKLGATRREISDRSRTKEENISTVFLRDGKSDGGACFFAVVWKITKSIRLANYGRKFHDNLLRPKDGPPPECVVFWRNNSSIFMSDNADDIHKISIFK